MRKNFDHNKNDSLYDQMDDEGQSCQKMSEAVRQWGKQAECLVGWAEN